MKTFQPIANTKYYQENQEDNQKKSAEEQSGLLTPLKKKLGGLYESLFGASLDSAEAKALYDFGEGIANAAIKVKGKEAEEYSKFLTREPSNEAADSVQS